MSWTTRARVAARAKTKKRTGKGHARPNAVTSLLSSTHICVLCQLDEAVCEHFPRASILSVVDTWYIFIYIEIYLEMYLEMCFFKFFFCWFAPHARKWFWPTRISARTKLKRKAKPWALTMFIYYCLTLRPFVQRNMQIPIVLIIARWPNTTRAAYRRDVLIVGRLNSICNAELLGCFNVGVWETGTDYYNYDWSGVNKRCDDGYRQSTASMCCGNRPIRRQLSDDLLCHKCIGYKWMTIVTCVYWYGYQ